MQRTRLRPGTTRVAMAAWALQSLVAVLWVISSVVDEASWWIWPFGLAWAGVALLETHRVRRQGVVVDDGGLQVLTGLSRSTAVQWGEVADISAEPDGGFVAHLAVVRSDRSVLETALAKGDERLRELWLSQRHTV